MSYFKIFLGEYAPRPPRSPKKFSSPLPSSEKFLGFLVHQSLFRLDPPLIDFTLNHMSAKGTRRLQNLKKMRTRAKGRGTKETTELSTGDRPPGTCTRSLSQSINWANCIICPKKSHKKDRKFHRIESTERTEKLQNAAQRRNDL